MGSQTKTSDKQHTNTMKMRKTLSNWSMSLVLGLACLAATAVAAPAGTFQLRTHSTMHGTDSHAGVQGWASTMYNHHAGTANQSLQISCRGLATNHVYHLMASWGTNGELVHLSDFVCNRSGAILMNHTAGTMHHYNGTNDPGRVWDMMHDWDHQLSWVIFPGTSSNWCGMMPAAAPQLDSMMGSGGGMGDMGGWDNHGGWDGHGGSMDHQGDLGDLCHGWPASSNWWSGLTNWWPVMASWCWDYTNDWNAAGSSNWWCSWRQGASYTLPLPPSVNPVPVLNGFVITDDHLQPVLTCDLATPDSFTYTVRCNFTNHGIVPDAKGSLQGSATKRATRFALSATGLAPGTTYYLDFDGANVSSVATDQHGRLQLRKLPTGVSSLRGVGKIFIEDRHYNVLLSATLPPD